VRGAVAKSKRPGADASIRKRRKWLTRRRRLTALFVTVGIFAQIAWFLGNETDCCYQGPTTGDVIVGSAGLALLFCAVLLYVPEGIRRARQNHRDNQEFKDRFR
jgi:hypothetical protein